MSNYFEQIDLCVLRINMYLQNLLFAFRGDGLNRIIISFGNMTITLSHILRIPINGIGFKIIS